ncbi:MAG: GTP-binding protein, partial [Lachnospiraceae bacterium]|nr:GTP-binding protein [Candidatus Equihabitans merdae]
MTNTVNSEATKIDIISGFLGAGKTTLIKKLLAGPLKGQQVVLIENEFGEIGIDGGFMQEAGIEVREMNSGCICCSLVGDFGRALKEVIDTYHPDRIVIEPSGVGKLSDVIKAVQDLNDETVMLNSFTTVADVNKVKMYMDNFGEFYSNQLQFARTVVLSRTDTAKATEERIEEICGIIRGLNPNAMIITTPVEKLDGAVVMEALEKGRTDESELMEEVKAEVARHHHHHHHHEDGEECCCGHDHHHHTTMMTKCAAATITNTIITTTMMTMKGAAA